MIQSAVAFAVAARHAKLESIVHMSQWLSHRAHPAIVTRQIWLIDELFADLPGIAYTTLNPGFVRRQFFCEVMDPAALLGLFPILTGHGRARACIQRGYGPSCSRGSSLTRTACGHVLPPDRPRLAVGPRYGESDRKSGSDTGWLR